MPGLFEGRLQEGIVMRRKREDLENPAKYRPRQILEIGQHRIFLMPKTQTT